MTIFDDQLLETGLSYTVDGLSLTFTSDGGALGNYTTAPFEGVWIGQGNDTNSVYTMTFSQPVTCLTFAFDASNAMDMPETFSNFSTSLNGGDAQDVAISISDDIGVTLTNGSIVTNGAVSASTGGKATVHVASAAFTSLSFTFSQSGSNNGSVIERVEVDTGADPQFTTAQIFRAEGELSFLSSLTLSAYKLDDDETVQNLVNDRSSAAEAAYQDAAGRLAFLSACDFTGDHIETLAVDDSAGGNFARTGLDNGIYTNGNAAALVGRSTDALFVSFRGTNDASAATGGALAGDTPDKGHWSSLSGDGMPAHYALFAELIAAIRDYVAEDDNNIDRIYVTGHSLGAAMVEALMDDWANVRVIAQEFASPGYGSEFGSDDTRITNLWIDGDPILGASPFNDNEGDANTIYHNLEEGENLDDGDVLHSMVLYDDFAHFLEANGISRDELRGQLHGIDYDKIFADVRVINEDALNFRIGGGANTIEGHRSNDLILGGGGADHLSGRNGRDYIDGGAGNDILVGGNHRDFLYGRTESDELRGGNGNDILRGGGARDTLTGGSGQDSLFGGAGRDIFDFNSVSETRSGNGLRNSDVIEDFGLGGTDDRIDLRGIDARSGLLGNFGDQAFDFIGRGGFSETKGELRYTSNGDRTTITGDRNGDGTADFRIYLTGSHRLGEDDFML